MMQTAGGSASRIPPAMLLRSTTAVDAPGVATSGTVSAVNAHTFRGIPYQTISRTRPLDSGEQLA